ncbi:MAG: efflux RND transporter permease subunit [Oceanococcaceae bacterium]
MEYLFRRGTLLTVITLVVCVLGVLAVFRVPIQMIPDLEVRTISVETRWSGATPQDVEKDILVEQEEYLRAIPGLTRLKAQASTGRAEIELEFPFGTDITQALLDVNNALAQVPAYPENVDQPTVSASSFSQNAFMYLRVQTEPGNPLGLDINLLQDYVDDNVRPRLERVPGVAKVDVGGGAERQIQILIDATALAARGLTLADVRTAIRARNRDRSGGDIDSGKRRFLLRTVGRVRDVDALRELIIARNGDSLVRLSDVAEVRLDHFEPRSLSMTDGEAAIGLSVRRLAGSNVVEIKRNMLPVIEDINSNVLAGVGLRLRLLTDDVKYVQASVANVWQNLMLGAVLAAFTMWLFLRSVPATLVGVLGIPICTIAAFLGLLAFGRTINVISLAGVAFAIGMTLDNSIVVLEAIERERRRGVAALDAAVAGVRRVWPAVLASTMTTVLVFAPILFIEEEAGQLYSDVAVAIGAAILVSMLVATTLIPAASLRLTFAPALVPVDGKETVGEPRLLRVVRILIATPLRRLLYLLGMVCITGWILFALRPPAEYLPEGEEPKTFARMIAPPGYNLTEMTAVAGRVQADLMPFVNADPAAFTRGELDVPPMAYMNVGVDPGGMRIIAETVDPQQINALMTALTDRYREEPGMRAFAARGSIISSNDGGTRSVNVDIAGAELADLFVAAQRVYDRAEQVFSNPQINSEPRSLSLTQPLIQILPRWDRLAEAGVSAEEFGYAVAALADGAFVDEFFIGDDKVDMFLFEQAGYGQTLAQLPDLPLATPQGIVPLSALADLKEVADTDQVRRINGRRTVTLNIIAPREIALETAVARVRSEVLGALIAEGQIPQGVTLDISGAADQLDATQQALGANFVVAVVLCYLLLVAIFTHWGYPLIILTSVPIGLAGGIAGLLLMNLFVRQPFDMISMLGFLILLGTVVNNPILIVDQARYNLRERGLAIEEAVTQAVRTRVRPILMSMTTTIVGLSPLVLIPGAGTELYRGVGAIVLFGLLFSTLVTLTFLPVLLTTIFRWKHRHPGAMQTLA